MPKVIGPLFSLTASGDLGKLIVYRRIGSSNIVSSYFHPKDRRTTAQTVHRFAMQEARFAWRNLPIGDKSQWRQKALGIPGTSGYNLFIKAYLQAYLSELKGVFNLRIYNTVNFC